MTVRWTRRLERVPGPVVAGDGRMFAAEDDTVRASDTGTRRTLWSVPGRAPKLGYDRVRAAGRPLPAPGARTYRRLAVGRLARGGGGRHAGSVRVRRLARSTARDRFVVCPAGGPRLGLARDAFEERCGRSRIPLR